MDIVTQGLLGASMAAAAAPRDEVRPAAACGCAAGLLADVDALIRSPDDALLVLEYHRHFTHALAFVPFGALIAAAVLWPLARRHFAFGRLYLYCLLGYGLSGLLDACTSYGTSLLWPFSEARIAWSIVSIVDPVFSLFLLVPLLAAIGLRRAGVVRTGLVLAALYLGAGAVQHERARDALADVAQARGHAPGRLLVKPTIGNVLLWRGLYLADGRLHADGVRVGTDVMVYPGETLPRAAVPAAGAAARFAVFSDDWLVDDPRHEGRLGDARYAMIPTSLRPLWGIEQDADGVVRFLVDRSMTDEDRSAFLRMLRGQPVSP